MRKKLTISLDEAVYDALSALVGRGGISKLIEYLVRPHALGGQLDAGYRAMAADQGSARQASGSLSLQPTEAMKRDEAR